MRRIVPALYSRLVLGECAATVPRAVLLPLRSASYAAGPNHGPLAVWIPHRPHDLLRCVYGPDYLTPDHVCDAGCRRCHKSPAMIAA